MRLCQKRPCLPVKCTCFLHTESLRLPSRASSGHGLTHAFPGHPDALAVPQPRVVQNQVAGRTAPCEQPCGDWGTGTLPSSPKRATRGQWSRLPVRKNFALSGTLLFSFSRQSRFLHGYNLAIKQMEPSALTHRLSPRMLPPLCVRVCMCVWALWSCHMNLRMSHGLQCWLLSQISTLREHKPSEWGSAVLGLYLRIPDTQVFIHSIHSYCPLTESGDRATEQTGILTHPLRAPSLDGASWSTNW